MVTEGTRRGDKVVTEGTRWSLKGQGVVTEGTRCGH